MGGPLLLASSRPPRQMVLQFRSCVDSAARRDSGAGRGKIGGGDLNK